MHTRCVEYSAMQKNTCSCLFATSLTSYVGKRESMIDGAFKKMQICVKRKKPQLHRRRSLQPSGQESTTPSLLISLPLPLF